RGSAFRRTSPRAREARWPRRRGRGGARVDSERAWWAWLFLPPEAERIARGHVDQELIEVVIVVFELRSEALQDRVVLRHLSSSDREAVHLGDDARLEDAGGEELVREAGRAVERAHPGELAVAVDRALGLVHLGRPERARFVVVLEPEADRVHLRVAAL